MRLIRAIRQRITDWRREVRINDLAACCLMEAEQGRIRDAMFAWKAMKAEIGRRSPQQVARMERKQRLTGARNA